MSILIGNDSVAVENMMLRAYDIERNELYEALYFHFDQLNNKKLSYTPIELKEWIKNRRNNNIQIMTKEDYVKFIEENKR